MNMRIAWVGSRSHLMNEQQTKAALNLLETAFTKMLETYPGFTYVSGHARGIDQWSEYLADKARLKKIIHLPRWTNPNGSLNMGAGFARNSLIVRDADIVIAIMNKNSKGTRDTVHKALTAGKVVIIYDMDTEKEAFTCICEQEDEHTKIQIARAKTKDGEKA